MNDHESTAGLLVMLDGCVGWHDGTYLISPDSARAESFEEVREFSIKSLKMSHRHVYQHHISIP